MGELSEALQFTFGLVNSTNKYLTAETFGFKIAASGSSLKKKQTWSLEQQADGADVFFKRTIANSSRPKFLADSYINHLYINAEANRLNVSSLFCERSCENIAWGATKDQVNFIYSKSFLGRYLGADKNGKVSCDAETPGDENAFQVEATSDGRWAIRSSKYGRYFGGSADNLSCFEQSVSPSYLWTIHLAMHPQVNIYNIRRKCYAHVVDEEVHMVKRTPWGTDTLITLVFKDKSYALVTSTNKYLANDGSVESSCSSKTLFTIEFHAGKISFKSKADGKYLSPVGPKGMLQGRKDTVGKDEHFTLVDSHPQITLFSKTKNKFVSGKQGLQLSANQWEAEENETFQMELDANTDSVYFRNDKDKYWRLSGNSISADVETNRSAETRFQIEWHGRIIRMIASNGKYVNVLPSGHLAVSDEAEDFIFRLTNRPLIVFRGENGFIGCKGDKLEGNKASYDIFQMEEDGGAYAIKAPSGKYWSVDDDQKVACNGTGPQYFVIQLVKGSKIALKPENGGEYITSDHVGIMTAKGNAINKSTTWEY